MMWLRDNLWLLAVVVGGIAVSIIVSETHSWRESLAKIAGGIFCAAVFPGPFLDIIGRDPSVYGNAVAGLFALTGGSFARMAVTTDREALASFIAVVIGRKK